MKRYGAVIVFTKAMHKEACEEWLAKLANGNIIEDPSTPEWKAPSGAVFPARSGVEKFDDDIGGPTWYIP